MNKIIAAIISVVALLAPTATQASTEQIAFQLHNQYRTSQKIKPLKWSKELAETANKKLNAVLNCTNVGYAKHYCPMATEDGTWIYYPDYDIVGENISLNYQTPEEAFKALLASPKHLANIQRAEYKEIGISCSTTLATSCVYAFGGKKINCKPPKCYSYYLK